MTFATRPILDNYTVRLIQAMECAAKQLIKQREQIAAIVLLREFAASPRVQAILSVYHNAHYVGAFDNGAPALSLRDGKDWVEALEADKSALDGFPV